MDSKKLYRIIGFIVFAIGLVVYWSTMQSSSSFWDCGEFAASSYLLQVPHPPGTPFFILMGKLFSMIPFAQNIGFRINLISVFSTALAGLFLYLSVVKFIENYRGKVYASLLDAFYTFMAAAIGALSFIFCETVWFNGVESEVYANSTFFIAFVFWLIALWNEKADEPDSSKYLLLISYLIGLSIGVHLMAVLAIVSIVMIVYFKKYLKDEAVLLKSSYLFIAHGVLITILACILWSTYTDTEPPSYSDFGTLDKKFILICAGVSCVFMAIFWKQIFKRNSFYIPIAAGGICLFAVYPGVVKIIPNTLVKIGGNNTVLDTILFVLIFVISGAGIYYFKKKGKPTIELLFKCFLFVMIGYTTYAQLMIRANQEVPINMNSPKTYTEALSYMNREQYGDFPIFKRRYTNEPGQQDVFTNYSSDLDFFLNYQMDHMFNRYFLWNYVGRASKIQDTGVDWTKLYGIPFLIGLFGIYFQFRKDWKMGWIFMVAFILLGLLTAFYQNQQEPQPRERDYFYVGAFFVYSMWIAYGIRGILDMISELVKNPASVKALKAFTVAVLFLLIPVNMYARNHWENDRSKNYVPWDYAYNMLQSCEPNAILFTNGDNDTFPLWYLQSVEGVRRDVRIANLSLINTPWYIKQLKDTTPFGAMKVPISMSEIEIDSIRPARWDNREETLDVPRDMFEKLGVKDTAVIRTGQMKWRIQAQAYYGEIPLLRQQDIMIRDIILTNKWQRPIYFAATCSDDTKLGLEQYLINEGMAFKLTPNKVIVDNLLEYVNEPVLRKQLLEEPQGYSKDYQPGFKFRGLNDKSIYFDENHEHMTSNYRNMFVRLALYYLNIKDDKAAALKTLDKMEEKIPHTVIPMPDPFYKDNIARFFLRAGSYEKYRALALEVVRDLEKALANNTLQQFDLKRVNPYEVLLFNYENLKEYKKALDLALKLQAMYPNDESVKRIVDKFKVLNGGIPETAPQTIPGQIK